MGLTAEVNDFLFKMPYWHPLKNHSHSPDMAKTKTDAKSKKASNSDNKDVVANSAHPTVLTQAPTATPQAPVPGQVVANLAAEVPLDDEVILTDAEGRRYCRATDCDQIGLVDGYCRFHYLLFWKKIQNRKKILADGKLERYIEELTARYTDKFIELLRKDLRTEKDFMAALQELELDDSSSNAADEDEAKSYIEEISGVAAPEARDDEGYWEFSNISN